MIPSFFSIPLFAIEIYSYSSIGDDPSMFFQYSLYIPSIFPQYLLNISSILLLRFYFLLFNFASHLIVYAPYTNFLDIPVTSGSISPSTPYIESANPLPTILLWHYLAHTAADCASTYIGEIFS